MNATVAIHRVKKGSGFHYLYRDKTVKESETLDRIHSLSIPPAWDEVFIAKSPKAKVLAVGRDEAGRQQSIYNPTFRAKQEKLKFDRILRFADALPGLRKQIKKDLARNKLSKDKVLACVVKLIDEAYFRVGNETYAKENQSYGITTLRSKHTEVKGDTVTFDFIGKSGKQHVKQITDSQIAGIVKRLDLIPGYQVFRYEGDDGKIHDLNSGDVNDYIHKHVGEEFSAKDFRTWGGTLVATAELMAVERYRKKEDRQRMVVQTVKTVAERLGNTPAIARSSYIDPRVVAAYVDNRNLEKVKKAMNKMRPRHYMTRDEQCVLYLLNQ